jgi:hypothetical protein
MLDPVHGRKSSIGDDGLPVRRKTFAVQSDADEGLPA